VELLNLKPKLKRNNLFSDILNKQFPFLVTRKGNFFLGNDCKDRSIMGGVFYFTPMMCIAVALKEA
jgi:hypothetical protein